MNFKLARSRRPTMSGYIAGITTATLAFVIADFLREVFIK